MKERRKHKPKRFKPTKENMHKYTVVKKSNETIYIKKHSQEYTIIKPTLRTIEDIKADKERKKKENESLSDLTETETETETKKVK